MTRINPEKKQLTENTRVFKLRERLKLSTELRKIIPELTQYKKDIGENEWNKLTTEQLISNTILNVISERVAKQNNKYLLIWKENLVEAMVRAKIIGDNMK